MLPSMGCMPFLILMNLSKNTTQWCTLPPGTKVVIEDIKPKTNWAIEDNYNEFAANAK